MGIYVYSMRKRTKTVKAEGRIVTANIFDYAYKVSNSAWWNEDKGYLFRARNTDRLACAARADAIEKGREYVIVGDSIYKDVTNPVWYDTDDFPGTFVGKVGE